MTNAVASVASSVCSARTISSSGMTATGVEEVEAHDPPGDISSFDTFSVTESDEVFVARYALWRDYSLDLSEYLLLNLHVSKYGFNDRSQRR